MSGSSCSNASKNLFMRRISRESDASKEETRARRDCSNGTGAVVMEHLGHVVQQEALLGGWIRKSAATKSMAQGIKCGWGEDLGLRVAKNFRLEMTKCVPDRVEEKGGGAAAGRRDQACASPVLTSNPAFCNRFLERFGDDHRAVGVKPTPSALKRQGCGGLPAADVVELIPDARDQERGLRGGRRLRGGSLVAASLGAGSARQNSGGSAILTGQISLRLRGTMRPPVTKPRPAVKLYGIQTHTRWFIGQRVA
ncbi:hypothetical protein B0H14DRAFT_2620561 [Mycena olivaceomarginata]|nr:hypothetical protein B0H14DRAFT_2620561 [Mycena olivaceomarginata]